MTISTHITRLAKIFALAFVAAAFVVPAATANDGLVDDWFRDPAIGRPVARLPRRVSILPPADRSRVGRGASRLPVDSGRIPDSPGGCRSCHRPATPRVGRGASRLPVDSGGIPDSPAGVDPATGRPLRESGGAPVAYRSAAGGFQTPAAGVDPATGRPLRESGGASVAYQSTAAGFQWDDFGIGAGAMLGPRVAPRRNQPGRTTARHRGGPLKTS